MEIWIGSSPYNEKGKRKREKEQAGGGKVEGIGGGKERVSGMRRKRTSERNKAMAEDRERGNTSSA